MLSMRTSRSLTAAALTTPLAVETGIWKSAPAGKTPARCASSEDIATTDAPVSTRVRIFTPLMEGSAEKCPRGSAASTTVARP